MAINYVSSEDRAKALAGQLEQDHKIKAVILQGVRPSHVSLTVTRMSRHEV